MFFEISNNLAHQCIFYVYLFCFFVFLCTRQKERQKRKEGNLMKIVYF